MHWQTNARHTPLFAKGALLSAIAHCHGADVALCRLRWFEVMENLLRRLFC